ncbi:hypothetical protein ACFQHW_01755 [Lapidilactobacillus achengensis]|uniref:Uncharacterized protein n=1 Tax=Lapidilactobacillus achengensis TaxID=2486000 RepID=A0ABW1UMP2_9LACO|nr:hypothetical protein [Lapidilactobacillus achengensis]
MKSQFCKKCQRPLPEGYKHRYCESCRNQQAENLKKTGKGLLALAGSVASLAVVVVTKGKINPKS